MRSWRIPRSSPVAACPWIRRRRPRWKTLKAVVSEVRALKAAQGEAASRVSEFVVETSEAHWAVLEVNLAKLKRMLGAASIVRGAMSPSAPAIVTPLGSWNLIRQLKGDVGVEKTRLAKEIETLAKHIAGTEARLGNEAFVSKAPPAVLEGARKQLADLKAKKTETETPPGRIGLVPAACLLRK